MAGPLFKSLTEAINMKTAAVATILLRNIEAFRLVGYSTWTGEAVSSNLAFYTNDLFV